MSSPAPPAAPPAVRLLSDHESLQCAERALHAHATQHRTSSAGEHAMLLGYLRYRDRYPARKDVAFYGTRDACFVARVERARSPDLGGAKLDLCAAAVCDHDGDGDGDGGTARVRYISGVRALLGLLGGADALIAGAARWQVGAVTQGLLPLWREVLGRGGAEETLYDCVRFVEKPAEEWGGERPGRALPEDLRLDALASADADLVGNHWPYLESEGAAYLRGMLDALPSVCVRPAGAVAGVPPVAWMLAYPYAAFGCLHVVRAQRRRGLGGALVSAICDALRADAGATALPAPNQCFVIADNVPSRRMLTRPDFDLAPRKAFFVAWERAPPADGAAV